MPPQITRLVLLTIGIVGSYLLARHFLTPQSFGQYGWYRGDALMELATRDRVFAGRHVCAECHSDQVQKLSQKEHRTLSCEGCHGPGQAHAENPDVKISIQTYGHCIRCHEASTGRPKWLKQINSKAHYTGQKCTECHVPHQPSEVP